MHEFVEGDAQRRVHQQRTRNAAETLRPRESAETKLGAEAIALILRMLEVVLEDDGPVDPSRLEDLIVRAAFE